MFCEFQRNTRAPVWTEVISSEIVSIRFPRARLLLNLTGSLPDGFHPKFRASCLLKLVKFDRWIWPRMIGKQIHTRNRPEDQTSEKSPCSRLELIENRDRSPGILLRTGDHEQGCERFFGVQLRHLWDTIALSHWQMITNPRRLGSFFRESNLWRALWLCS